MIDIHLYLGAHKTATTHLQGILLANRERLAAKNIGLSAPCDVRKNWLPQFIHFCASKDADERARIAADLAAIAPRDGLWILTEENILGISNDFTYKPGIYPFAGKRLRNLTEVFAGAKATLFFSLRSYDSFYRSAYSEVVRNRGFLPFAKFYDEDRFLGNSWVTTIHMFERVLGQENIVLWRFEDFRALLPDLLRRMTGIESVQELMDAYKPETTRPSLSRKTIEILEDLYPVIDRKESLALVERINKAYPVHEGHEAFTPFTAEQEEAFRQQYDLDVETIKSRFPAIQFLAPAA